MRLFKKILYRLLSFCINSLNDYTEDELWEMFNEDNTFITKDEICRALNIPRCELSERIKNNIFPKGRKRKGKKDLFWVKEELVKIDSRIERCQEYSEDRMKKAIKELYYETNRK